MELDKPIDIIHTSEELDDLARSFNVMRERLQAAMAEINQFTQHLETKVEQRTEQLKAAHQKLLQSDRLASLGQLSASVAHEINNPLSGVLNLSMLMQRLLTDDGIPPGRLQDFRKYLSQVVNETTRVGRIVSDLLAFSRRSKPQRVEAESEQDRHHHALADLAQAQAHERGGRSWTLQPDLPAGAVRPLADPAGGVESASERRGGHAKPRRETRLHPHRGGPCHPGRGAVGDRFRRRHLAGETWPKSSIPSSPRSPRAKASGWAWRSPTESSRRTAAISK